MSLALVVFVLSVWWARELQTHFDELEGLLMQAASAQTADPVEDAKQAVPPRVLLLACLACCGLRLSSWKFAIADCGLCPAGAVEDGSGERGDEGAAPAQNSCCFDVD